MSANLESSAVATGLEKSVFIPIPKRAMPKNIQTTVQLHSFHKLARLGFPGGSAGKNPPAVQLSQEIWV